MTLSILFQSLLCACYLTSSSFDLFINTSVFFQYSLILEYTRSLFKSINDEFNALLRPPDNNKIFSNEVKQSIKIDNLLIMYNLLGEISEEVSEFYSLIMMWSIFNNFFSLFVSRFADFKRLSGLGLRLRSRGVLFDVVSIYYNAIRLPILTISVNNTLKEVNSCCMLIFFVFKN